MVDTILGIFFFSNQAITFSIEADKINEAINISNICLKYIKPKTTKPTKQILHKLFKEICISPSIVLKLKNY
jgi:hypothetical protein